MTTNSYLGKLSASAIIRDIEKESISRSIETLKSRVSSQFGAGVSQQQIFGSYTRSTLLPRRIDTKSDVDYMIVFSDTSLRPQTYMNQLRAFVARYYSSSAIAQSSPTIVLDLNHIRFELVPAIDSLFVGLQIPAPANDYMDWLPTSPNDFNSSLIEKNNTHSYKIKPAIRLAKYWNAINGYVFPSYELEKSIVGQSFYGCNDLSDYFYAIVNGFSVNYFAAQRRQIKIQQAKSIVATVQNYEAQDMPLAAERELKKLLPDFT